MAILNTNEGTIVARCPGCDGAKSTFEWIHRGREIGAITKQVDDRHWRICLLDFRLFRCAGCGIGAMGVVKYGGNNRYPGSYNRLLRFIPEAKERVPLPPGTPKDIMVEFREAEKCLENNCLRAAASMFRSVLDKTMRANGYHTTREKRLFQQIDGAAKDGVITLARKKRAHCELRLFGNDVLVDDWHEVTERDVEVARRYCQRILEDFYDDRESVINLLKDAGRISNADDNNKHESKTRSSFTRDRQHRVA